MQRAARTDTAREGTLGLDANRRHTTRTHATYAIRHEGLRGMGALGKLARRRCRIERMRCATSSETHDGARVPCCAGCVWLQQRCNNQCDVQHTTYNLPRNRPQTTRCRAPQSRAAQAWSRCMNHAPHTINWGALGVFGCNNDATINATYNTRSATTQPTTNHPCNASQSRAAQAWSRCMKHAAATTKEGVLGVFGCNNDTRCSHAT
jgi:hypothetical protein